MSQANLWNVLPPDVLRSILEKLPFRDAWTCRSLSSCWASAFRASVPVELVIPAKRRNLRAKLRRLQQTPSQSSNTLPDRRSYTFKLTELTSVADCGRLLRSLTKEGKVEAPCQVLIQLQAPQAASLPTLEQTVAKVAAAIAQLTSNNIIVCIGLDAGKTGALPSPSFLNKLAPILNQLDCLTSLRLSNRHIWALLPSTSRISSLSVSRHRFYTGGYHQYNFSLELLASFTNLRQLELHLDTREDLTHLSTLKGLLEFHLTVRRHGWSDSNCGHILKSNRDSLLHVSLTAESWDDRTYWALPHLSKLRTFSLRVEQLRHGNALVLSQLRPSQSMSVTFNKTDLVSRMIMQEVTSFDAHITYLTLHEVCPFARTMHLQTMQHLTSLTLVGLDPTRTDFQPQPRLQMQT